MKYSLRSLTIKQECFQNAVLFSITDNHALSTLSIGKQSFNVNNGHINMRNCSELKSLSFGEESFYNYISSFQLNNMTKLESISFGPKAFYNTLNMDLYNLPALRQIEINTESFKMATSLTMNNMAALNQIIIGDRVFFNAYTFELQGINNYFG